MNNIETTTDAAQTTADGQRAMLRAYISGDSPLDFESARDLFGWNHTDDHPWLSYDVALRQALLTNVLRDNADALNQQREAGMSARVVAVVDAPPSDTSRPCYAFVLIPEVDWYMSAFASLPLTVHIEIIAHAPDCHEGFVVCDYFDFMHADRELEAARQSAGHLIGDDVADADGGARPASNAATSPALARMAGNFEAIVDMLHEVSAGVAELKRLTLLAEGQRQFGRRPDQTC